MTKKNYEEIAKIIRECDSTTYVAYTDKVVLIDMLMTYFKKDNEMFNAEKFQASCYKEEGGGE